jgi:hypothetical protein
MAVGIEANNDSSSEGRRRVTVRSVGVTGRLERAGEALILERLAWFLALWARATWNHLMATSPPNWTR